MDESESGLVGGLTHDNFVIGLRYLCQRIYCPKSTTVRQFQLINSLQTNCSLSVSSRRSRLKWNADRLTCNSKVHNGNHVLNYDSPTAKNIYRRLETVENLSWSNHGQAVTRMTTCWTFPAILKLFDLEVTSPSPSIRPAALAFRRL